MEDVNLIRDLFSCVSRNLCNITGDVFKYMLMVQVNPMRSEKANFGMEIGQRQLKRGSISMQQGRWKKKKRRNILYR